MRSHPRRRLWAAQSGCSIECTARALAVTVVLAVAICDASVVKHTYASNGARPGLSRKGLDPWWRWSSAPPAADTGALAGAYTAPSEGHAGCRGLRCHENMPVRDVCSTVPVGNAAYARDLAALIDLFHALNGPAWANTTGWMQPHNTSMCTFHQVWCSANCTVEAITLSDDAGVRGQLPDSLANLKDLTSFTARRTAIRGSVPAAFGRLTKLTVLEIVHSHLTSIDDGLFTPEVPLTSLILSNNHIVGTVPQHIGVVASTLNDLELSHNRLFGPLPESLWACTHIGSLLLGHNYLSGTLSPRISNMSSSLRFLALNSNKFHGPLPSQLYRCTLLIALHLYENLFDGQLSSSIGDLVDLRDLNLARNKIGGNVPDELFNLVNLQSLHLTANKFHGSLSEKIGQLHILTSLGMGDNFFEGKIPESVYSLTQLVSFSLFQNLVAGSISRNVSRLVNLKYFDVDSQDRPGLTQTIPHELFQLPLLESLWLSNNDLRGTLPRRVSGVPHLRELLVDGNPQLGGQIPQDIGNLTQLEWLLLNNCTFEGKVPDLTLPKLQVLNLAQNKLNGTLSGIVHAPMLEMVALFDNNFVGGLPEGLGTLRHMRSMLVSSPNFGGELIDEMQHCTSLETLSIVSSGLTGTIPDWIGNLTKLKWMVLVGNDLVGRLPTTLARLSNLKYLDLGANPRLHGRLPDFTGLRNLTRLSVRGCAVGGTLPKELGSLPYLDTLCLDSNQFSCHIPWGAAALPSCVPPAARHDLRAGVCLPHEVTVLSGNAFACDIPRSLSHLDSLASAYQCLPSPPAYVKQGGLLLAATAFLVIFLATGEYCSSYRSDAHSSYAPREYRRVSEYLKFAKWAAWTSLALSAVAAAAAATNSQAQSGMECRQDFVVSLYGVRYDVVNTIDDDGDNDGTSSPIHPLVVAAAPLFGVCVWTVAVGYSPRSRRRKPQIEEVPSASSLAETTLMRPLCALVMGILAVIVLTVAPNVGYVLISGSVEYLSNTKLLVSAIFVFVKATVNAVVVPYASRWLLAYASPNGQTAVAFLPSFWLSLSLRLLNIVVVPVATVLVLDPRCLYGALQDPPRATVDFNVTYCASHGTNLEGDWVKCNVYANYGVAQGISTPWRWSPACGGAVLQRYGGIVALSITLEGTAFIIVRVLREALASRARRAAATRGDAARSLRGLPCGRWSVARRAWRGAMEPWHATLSTRYSNSMMILTAALTYGICAFPPIALASTAALAFTAYVHGWLLRRELLDAADSGIMGAAVSIEAGTSRTAAGRAVAGGTLVAMMLSSVFYVLMFGGGAFEGSAAAYVGFVMPVAAVGCYGISYLLMRPYRHRRSQRSSRREPLLSDDSSVPSTDTSEGARTPTMGGRSGSEIAMLLRGSSSSHLLPPQTPSGSVGE